MPHGFGSRLFAMKIASEQDIALAVRRAETVCLGCGCGGVHRANPAEKETGLLVCAIGLFFIPFLVGIPILIFGLHLQSRISRRAFCGQCGFLI